MAAGQLLHIWCVVDYNVAQMVSDLLLIGYVYCGPPVVSRMANARLCIYGAAVMCDDAHVGQLFLVHRVPTSLSLHVEHAASAATIWHF